MKFYFRVLKKHDPYLDTASGLIDVKLSFWVSSENGKISSVYRKPLNSTSTAIIRRELLELEVSNLCICQLWRF